MEKAFIDTSFWIAFLNKGATVQSMDRIPYLIISPKKGWQLIYFKELGEYRDPFYFLITYEETIESIY